QLGLGSNIDGNDDNQYKAGENGSYSREPSQNTGGHIMVLAGIFTFIRRFKKISNPGIFLGQLAPPSKSRDILFNGLPGCWHFLPQVIYLVIDIGGQQKCSRTNNTSKQDYHYHQRQLMPAVQQPEDTIAGGPYN